MTCKQCGRHGRIRDGLCPACTTARDLEKAGYTAREIRSMLKLIDFPKDYKLAKAQ